VPPVDHAGSRLVLLAGQRLAAVAQALQVGGDFGGEFTGAVRCGLASAGAAVVDTAGLAAAALGIALGC
jgi:hypothetical protein